MQKTQNMTDALNIDFLLVYLKQQKDHLGSALV